MANLKLEYYEGISTVSRARSSNISTIIVNTAHGLITGDTVTITDLGGSDYNDSDVTVTVTDSVTFTYPNTGADEGTTGDTAGLVFPNFVFPYNPNSIEFGTNKFIDQRNLPYSFTFLGFTSPIKSSIDIGLNGHFTGTNKNLNYRSFVRKINAPILLKLFFENSGGKFYLCTGTTIQKVPTGTRPLHVDYVGRFFSPFGLLFDATQKSGANGDADLNAGDIQTPIEKITGTVVSGNLVTIRDSNNNGFKFTPDRSGTMVYNLVKIVNSDNFIYYSEYFYVEVAGVIQIVQNANTSGDILLRLDPKQSLNNIFSGGAVTGITSDVFYFRDGWSSD